MAPGDPFITDSLGWVEYRLGNLAEAARLLREAFAKRADVEIALHLGEVLWVMGEREAARQAFVQARDMQADSTMLKEVLQAGFSDSDAVAQRQHWQLLCCFYSWMCNTDKRHSDTSQKSTGQGVC